MCRWYLLYAKSYALLTANSGPVTKVRFIRQYSIDRSLNASYADFRLLCFAATTTKMTTGQVAAASQSIARAFRKCAIVLRRCAKALFSARKRRSETRYGCLWSYGRHKSIIAKEEHQKAERKCWTWALKTRHQKHGNVVTFFCMQRVPEWMTVLIPFFNICSVLAVLSPGLFGYVLPYLGHYAVAAVAVCGFGS